MEDGIRADIASEIRRLYPDGVADFQIKSKSRDWQDVVDTLRKSLAMVPDASLMYERDWESKLTWGGTTEEDEVEGEKLVRSYHSFFLGLRDHWFESEVEEEVLEDELAELPADEISEDIVETDDGESIVRIRTITVENTPGCIIAVPLQSRVALIRWECATTFPDGDVDAPDIDRVYYDDKGWVDSDRYYRRQVGNEAFVALEQLRDDLVDILNELHIIPILESQARIPVPWLHPGDRMFRSDVERPMTVEEAFFYVVPAC